MCVMRPAERFVGFWFLVLCCAVLKTTRHILDCFRQILVACTRSFLEHRRTILRHILYT
uniref:Uncharacterized protein n=1 Tax=Ciona intestinalis TaxID=7719 RepID=H2XR35_CIOIN